jgi:LPS-assembly lipoprotein
MSTWILCLAFAALMAGTLSACGFHPLYANYSPGSGGAQILDSVYVDPIEGEIAGYELRNSLIDGLHSPQHPADAAYRLKIEIKQTIQAISVENNASITRYNYVLQGKYELTDTKGKVVKQGIENTLDAYDVVTSPYATLAAEHDAQRRGARDLAYRIQVELAVFLAHRKS